MDEDKKKILIVAIIGGIAIVGFLVFAFTVILGDKKPVEVVQTESARPAVPDAVEENLFADKESAYNSPYSKEEPGSTKTIEDIWSSLESDEIGAVPDNQSLAEKMFGISPDGHVVDQKPVEEKPAETSAAHGRRRDSSSGSTGGSRSELVVSRSSSATAAATPKPAKPKVTEPEPVKVEEEEVEPEVPEKTTRPQRTTGWNNSTSGIISSLSDSDADMYSDWGDAPDEKFVKCCFAKDYRIKNSTRITLRLLENLYLDEVVIPANTRISATCTVSSRLTVTITGFELNGKVYSANYTGYDITDCKPGIYCYAADDRNSRRVQREAISQGARTARNVLAYGGGLGALASDAVGIASTIGNSDIAQTQVDIPAGFEFYIKKSKR